MEEQITQYKTGMVMIPDISGFTDFVINTNMFVGRYITEKLLKSILDSNRLALKVSEIEGDAILFYKYNNIPTFDDAITQVEIMYNNFKKEVARLALQFAIKIPLSLKIILHYGSFSKYSIGKFEKLYGVPVIEAHNMLKNSVAGFPPYALFSEAFLKINFEIPFHSINKYHACDSCKYLPDIGYIHYL
ncbi:MULTISPECIES: DUF2652 domain-containing protein [Olivibacter]|jgi:hypothetical protein|uniref:DUF2652 domain-containing protein n=2 Tax=Olivibacter TaxID=376469 RepID=A0ABV6HQK4_9SPHI|nr:MULTISPECIES: DUF2652 domain-containing protein [Olivibacter]MDX3917429.1 DUF2652 domain-containing protein [Pseudosphingobacterium sp.]QEL03933.1 DUF2652 domain-containing protein [Olivibacter sp. LS-1]